MSIRYFVDMLSEDNGKLFVAGWASSDTHKKVEVLLEQKDGSVFSDCRVYDIERQDISRYLYDTPEYANCGFEIEAVTDGAAAFLKLTDGETTKKVPLKPDGWRNKLKQKKKSVVYYKNNLAYQLWLSGQQADKGELEKQRNTALKRSPVFSIVVPAYRTSLDFMKEMIESVKAQSYENWELCISDAGALDGKLEKMLLQYSKKDPRIRVAITKDPKGISDNTNIALGLVQGDYVAFMDHDDLLEPDTLFEIAVLINEDPETDIIYTDEDKVTMDKKTYFEPHFKPDFNRELLLTNNYISHFLVIKREIVDKVGGFRAEYDGSQDYDFLLRSIVHAKKIAHLDRVCYHWRSHPGSTASAREAKNYCAEAGLAALQDYIKSNGILGRAEETEEEGYYRIVYDKTEITKKISVVFSGVSDFGMIPQLEQRLTAWGIQDGEVVLGTKAGMMKPPKGELVLFLDVEQMPEGDRWLTQMLGIMEDKTVGAVFGKLVNPGEILAHVGLSMDKEGTISRMFAGFPEERIAYANRTNLRQEVLGALPHFLMTRGALLNELGGFKSSKKPLWQGMEYSLKLRQRGYRIVYEPQARLLLKRPFPYTSTESMDGTEKKWLSQYRDGDPYLPKVLTRDSEGNYKVSIF